MSVCLVGKRDRQRLWQVRFGRNTNVTSTLEVFLGDMRYISPRFTYLLTYLLNNVVTKRVRCVH